jgi:GT2 family glycosyltransferase
MYPDTKTNKDGVSAVLLTFNTPLELVKKCLDAIHNYNDIGESLEIILVDNNSDNQVELQNFVETNFGDVVFVPNSNNRGYGAGNNLGITQATHDHILLINPDVELVEPLFSWAINEFINDPKLNILGIQQVNQYNKKTHSFIQRRLTRLDFIINQLLQKLNIFIPKYTVVSGACFFLRKSSFMAIGGYDENIFLYGEERYLHESMLAQFPDCHIKMDFSKSYKHPISNRKFSLNTARLALESYFYLNKKLMKNTTHVKKEQIAYHKTLILFYSLKNKKQEVTNNRSIIELIEKTQHF